MAGVRVANDKGLMALVVAVLVMFVTLASVASGSEGNRLVPAVYVFGDSTVDVGNNQYIPGHSPLPHPYGIDLPQDSILTARVSNGYNIADAISRLLGFETSPPAYLSLTPETSNQIHMGLGGVNYASGDSGILDKTGSIKNVLSMKQQVEFFAATKANMTEYAGANGSEDIDRLLSESLFLISAGGNDMFEFILSPGFVARLPTFYAQLLSNYTKHVDTLYTLGARRFGIVDVPPIGCVPALRNRTLNGGCLAIASLIAKRFNYKLGLRMASLAAESKYSNMTYSVGSSYKVVKKFTDDPEAAGFTEVASACCGGGRLGVNPICSLPGATYCGDRNDHLYWDFAHSSQATAIRGADIIFNAPVVEGYATPINFKQLVSPTNGFDGFSSS